MSGVYSKVEEMPADPAGISGGAYIGIQVWAHLQGVLPATVMSVRSRSDKRRGSPDAKPGDMPAEDKMVEQSPMWLMSTFRAWTASRPGQGAFAGRPPGTGRPREAKTVRLPLTCPHCEHGITGSDLPPLQPGVRAHDESAPAG